MKPSLVAAILLGTAFLSAAQPEKSGSVMGISPLPAPRAWMGVRLEKPDRSITVHVPSLPPGIGFVVTSTDDGGPARAAGIRKYDLLWKLGDQMLVNEAQLAALLRIANPGDEVVVMGFRGGKPIELKLKLGEAPALVAPFPGEMVDASVLPNDCDVPMRIINVSEKSASFSAEGGRAVVRREGGGYLVKISGMKNETIFDGPLASNDELDRVPESWRRRVQVLCRTLDQAVEGGAMPQREPRPRVVPTALSKP